jgi:hypothetical protein
MNTRLVIPLLLAGAVALACGSRSHSEATPVAPVAKVTDVVTPPRHATKLLDGDPQIHTSFSVSAQPHKLRFALNLTNPSKKHVELAFPTGQEYDFSIVDTGGREVYRWGSGRMFTQSRQNRLLDGGDTMKIEESASETLPPGSYVAVATLHSSNFPIEQRVAFEHR